MQANLFRAEWDKIASNRITVGALVWVFPITTLVISLLAIVGLLLSESFRETQIMQGVYTWDESFLFLWQVLNSEISRFTVVIFAAIVFAGEFQNGTWKQLITRQTRTRIIVHKFLVLTVFVTVAFISATVIYGIANGLVAAGLGLDWGAFSGERLVTFLGDYLMQVAVTLSATLIATGYAAVAAILTQNVVAAAITGVLFTLAEQATLVLISLINGLFGVDISGLYQLMPSYNLSNVLVWQRTGSGFQPFGPDSALSTPLPLAVSVVIILVWLIGLGWLTVNRFRQADLTT
jgi:hypothetical protein